MSLYFNRVKFAASTTGTADFGIGAAVAGFLTPSGASITNGIVVSYTAFSADGTQWETGHGVYNTAGPTLSRTTVLDSTAGFGTLVNFTLSPTVQIDLLAQDVIEDDLYTPTFAV